MATQYLHVEGLGAGGLVQRREERALEAHAVAFDGSQDLLRHVVVRAARRVRARHVVKSAEEAVAGVRRRTSWTSKLLLRRHPPDISEQASWP